MLPISAAPGRPVLASPVVLLLLWDEAVDGRGWGAKVPDEDWKASGGSSLVPLQGLLWPEVDVEAIPGAGTAKRLGVVGSCPAADPDWGSKAGCFVCADAARLTW